MATLIMTAKVNNVDRKPGSLTCWLVLPSTRPPGLTIFSLGIGVLAKHAPRRQLDLGRHPSRLHHHLSFGVQF
jgi:hypothetical protein